MRVAVQLSLLTFVLSASIKAQNNKRLELGTTAEFAARPGYYRYITLPDAHLQWSKGLFLRYNFKRLSIRGMASYWMQHEQLLPPPGSADFPTVEHDARTVFSSLGFQYQPSKKFKPFYCFLDANYGRTVDAGISSGGYSGWTYRFNNHTNSVGAAAGIGLKIKFFRVFTFSPEVGYAASRYFETDRETMLTGPVGTYTYFRIENGRSMIYRFHLAICF